MIGDSHSDYAGNKRGTFGFFGQHMVELLSSKFDFSLYAASGSSPIWWFPETPSQAATWGYTQTAKFPLQRACRRGSKLAPCVPKLDVLLASIPDLFIVQQGTNMLGNPNAATQVKRMMELIGKTKSIWVGAPNARPNVHSVMSQDRLRDAIKSNVPNFFDSRFFQYSPDANNDGEHLSMKAAGLWAEKAAKAVEELLV
jgi:hypothetical protein